MSRDTGGTTTLGVQVEEVRSSAAGTHVIISGLRDRASRPGSTGIAELLSGGDPRALGRVPVVIDIVLRGPARLGELFECLSSDDPIVRMRASDALEKVARRRPDLLEPFVEPLLGEVATIEQPSVQWHLAQIVGEVRLNTDQRRPRRGDPQAQPRTLRGLDCAQPHDGFFDPFRARGPGSQAMAYPADEPAPRRPAKVGLQTRPEAARATRRSWLRLRCRRALQPPGLRMPIHELFADHGREPLLSNAGLGTFIGLQVEPGPRAVRGDARTASRTP